MVKDIHAYVAEKLLSSAKKDPQKYKETRLLAKILNFGLNYLEEKEPTKNKFFRRGMN